MRGWSFALYDSSRVVCAYRCDWDDDIRVDDARYSRAGLQQVVPSVHPALLDDFEGRLHPQDFDALIEAEPSKLFAQAMGLERYDWLAYDNVAGRCHTSPTDFPGVIEVI